MFHDYAHAARYFGCDDAAPDCQPSDETERLYALKVIIEACGYDIPDPLFADLETAISDDVTEIENEFRRNDCGAWREGIEANLKRGASLDWALRIVPALAAAEAKRQAEADARRSARDAVGAFIAGLFPQVPA